MAYQKGNYSEQVEKILSQMTVEEKVAQMQQLSANATPQDIFAEFKKDGKIIGNIIRPQNPISFSPTNMEMRERSGESPMFAPTSFGSAICLNIEITVYRTRSPIAVL